MVGHSHKASKIMVLDWKTGTRTTLAEDNQQLLLYAFGYWLSLKDDFRYKVRGVDTYICQPAIQQLEKCEYSIPELLLHIERLREVAVTIQSGKGVFAADAKRCRYCPVKPWCPEAGTAERKGEEWIQQMMDNAADLVPLSVLLHQARENVSAEVTLKNLLVWLRKMEVPITTKTVNGEPKKVAQFRTPQKGRTLAIMEKP